MRDSSVKEEFKALLPLEDLRKELSDLEAGSFPLALPMKNYERKYALSIQALL